MSASLQSSPTPADRGAKSHLGILAVVEEAHSTRRCLAVAALAGDISRHTTLTALHIEVDPARIYTAPEEISLQKLRTSAEGSSADRAKRVRRMFEFWCANQNSLNAAWASKAGTVETVLTAESANADLIVLARPHNMDSFDALHGALFEARKLVLFVPDTNNLGSVHRRMIIAWKDRAQATRAVEQTLPWLAAAAQVIAVSVEESGGPEKFEELRKILGTRGVKADYRVLRAAPDEHPSDRILREAKAEGADSLVMGAFRFGMIAEWFFGGVTRNSAQHQHSDFSDALNKHRAKAAAELSTRRDRMLNPLAYKALWTGFLLLGGAGAALPPLLIATNTAYLSVPSGLILVVVSIRHLKRKRRVRLPRKRTLS